MPETRIERIIFAAALLIGGVVGVLVLLSWEPAFRVPGAPKEPLDARAREAAR